MDQTYTEDAKDPSVSSNNSSTTLPLISGFNPMKLSCYVEALRPWSFSASLMPVLLGCAVAHKKTGEFSLAILILTSLCALSVHGAGNLVNTYYDFVKGIDSKKSDDRTLVDQLLTRDEVVTLGAVLYGFGCIGFVLLVILSPARMEHLALVYFGGLSSSFMYTGGIGFKVYHIYNDDLTLKIKYIHSFKCGQYIALGDVMILIIFGPITVLFSYLAQSGQTEWATIYYAIPLALNTEAILHSNNTRDMKTDRRAGIVTLAILIGTPASIVLFACLLFLPYVMFTVVALHYSKWLLLPLVTLPSAFKVEKEFRSEDMRHIPKKVAKLNCSFALLYVIAVCMSKWSDLPYL